MQDRFKFRAWNVIVERFQYFDFKELSKMDYKDIQWHILKFQQCTGLKDKNGKLIYEGDIVQFYDDEFLQIMKIIWDNDELDFKAIGLKKSVECYEKDFSYLGYTKKGDSLEVIGNIYENKELIKGVQNGTK